MFLFVLSYISGYFALIEKYKASLIAMFPAFVLYFLVAGLQYDVGTDYFSYINIFEDSSRYQFYINRGEYLFAYLNSFLNWMELPSQSIFLSISFIQAVLVFIYFKSIKKKGFILTLLFIAFICVTNIYNNQLNALRQYVVIAALPLLTILLYEKRFFRFFILLGLVSLFHNTAWFFLFLLPVFFLYEKIKTSLIFIFSAMLFFYLGLGYFLQELISFILPEYSFYLKSEYAVGHNISLFITKLYYIPLILVFYSKYKKESDASGGYMHFMIVLFTIFYWFFILSIFIGIAERFYYYVIFFYVFPAYYLLNKYRKDGRLFEFALTFVYIVLPYVLKVTLLARGEFLYDSIIFN